MLRIFLTNLSEYNNGRLVGTWLSLPATCEELEQAFNDIGIDYDECDQDEYFITDSESDISGYKVGEYDDIDELNDIADDIDRLDSSDLLAVEAAIENGESIEAAIGLAVDGNYMIYHDCYDMEDVARQYCDECGVIDEIPEHLQAYFDYDAFGRDLDIDGTFIYMDEGRYVELTY